jgi:hypothetical protein
MQTLNINTQPPTRKEVMDAIKWLKTGKAAGKDGIAAEILNADITSTTSLILPLSLDVWGKEEIPAE